MAKGPVGDAPKRGKEQKVAPESAAYPPLPNAENLLSATVTWYGTWATSAQASRFTATDWQRLHMLAPLVEQYFLEPSAKLFSEIRLNEAKLGGTPEDRARLRWKIDEEKPAGDDEPKKPMSRDRRDPRKK